MDMKAGNEVRFAPFLDTLRQIEFVRALRFTGESSQNELGMDGVLVIDTAQGKFTFSVQHKNSYLDRALLNAFIVQAKHYSGTGRPLLLFARYIPRPSAERLVRSGVNFLDLVGNIHLALGNKYVRTVLGNKEAPRAAGSVGITPAKVQLLFTLAAEKRHDGTVREIAESSGVSKSNVAKLQRQMINENILEREGKAFESRYSKEITDHLVRGYEEVLRPKLLFHRYRMAERSSENALEKLRPLLAGQSLRWSLTGGAAAYELQPFYRGPDLVLFLEHPDEYVVRRLRLLPDREGAITVLRAFGRLTYWQRIGENVVAHPWLIYAELMRSADPRAHEAAEQLRSEFLKI